MAAARGTKTDSRLIADAEDTIMRSANKLAKALEFIPSKGDQEKYLKFKQYFTNEMVSFCSR